MNYTISVSVFSRQAHNVIYGGATVGIRWGNGGEPEGLGWAWQPQNQPLSGNRVHQTRMNWRQVNNLLLPQVTNPSFPTTTFRNNPILLGLI